MYQSAHTIPVAEMKGASQKYLPDTNSALRTNNSSDLCADPEN